MVNIRSYNPKNLEDTVKWYQAWHQTLPHIQHPQAYYEWKERFCDRLAVKGNVWVAEAENRIVGFIVVMILSNYLNKCRSATFQ